MNMRGALICSLLMSTIIAGQDVLEDTTAIHRHLAHAFNNGPLMEKVISVRSKPAQIQDIIELIALSTGFNFVIDANVTGVAGKINFERQKAGDILSVICNRNNPRLALIKQADTWRIMRYDEAVTHLKSMQREQLVQRVFHLQHVRCNEALKQKIDDMWRHVTITDRHKAAYCSLDIESKKVFLRARARQVQEMARFLKEIDCIAPQVRIDAIVAEVDSKYEDQLGFNWSGMYNRRATAKPGLHFLGIGTKDAAGASSEPFAINLFSRVSSAVKIPIVFGGSDSLQKIIAQLRAAQIEEKAKILLKPSVLTGHDENAEILIGKSVPIKTIVEDVVQGKLRNVQSISYKDVGTILNVRPLVSPDGVHVLLDIWVEDSSIADNVSAHEAPIIKTIRTKNKVTLRSGQSTVIGGLMLNRDERVKNSMPVLSRLPLFGRLFRNEHYMKEDSQLFIFITPTIIT